MEQLLKFCQSANFGIVLLVAFIALAFIVEGLIKSFIYLHSVIYQPTGVNDWRQKKKDKKERKVPTRCLKCNAELTTFEVFMSQYCAKCCSKNKPV